MLPQEIVRRKRDGRALEKAEIDVFVRGLTDGAVSESQAAALAMAVFLNGMTRDETVALTLAMRDSGSVLAWDGLDGPVVDKHSTGGVGDTVSLMLAPMLAACGCYVPMISGRGLGHTGGTLDKMDAIPGYRSQPGLDLFRKTVREAGCVIGGQTGELAPADRRLYAIRDVTATVESIPLIVASILSKKLAEGLDGLVLDVKTGSGAFMATESDARTLARALAEAASGCGLIACTLLTDMDEPLGSAAGNAVETANAIAYLTGSRRDARLHAVTMALGAALLTSTGRAATPSEAEQRLSESLSAGAAAERFQRMVSLLGGPNDLVENPGKSLTRAPVVRPVFAESTGTIAAIDTRALGIAVVELGGGRRKESDDVDLAVGFTDLACIGEPAARNFPFATIHARDEAGWERAAATVRAAYRLGDPPGRRRPVIATIEP